MLTPQTRIIVEVVDKTTYADMKDAFICFNCYKKKALYHRKLLVLAGLITIVLGVFTIVVADQMSLLELGEFYTTPAFYWIGGGILAIIGIIVTGYTYRIYKNAQSWKSKADLL